MCLSDVVCQSFLFGFVFSSEHSCDVDSAPSGEFRLPLLGAADVSPHLHPAVKSHQHLYLGHSGQDCPAI